MLQKKIRLLTFEEEYRYKQKKMIIMYQYTYDTKQNKDVAEKILRKSMNKD